MSRPATYDQKWDAVARIRKGESPEALAAELGFGIHSVRSWAKEAGLKLARKPYPPKGERREQAEALLQEGLKPKEVARTLNVQLCRVKGWRDLASAPKRRGCTRAG